MEPINTTCRLCGAAARMTSVCQPGYRVGTTYRIFACCVCETSFAEPFTVEDGIYEEIYRNVRSIPGYARYFDYAEAVAAVADPLGFLAAAEDVYWGVARSLRSAAGVRRVLEIGSGYGYLTYALGVAGYDVLGLDLSREAVARARSRFGNRFVACDSIDYASVAGAGRWDVVVFCELIEHVPDLDGFFAAALRLLAPGGRLILTTPNKTFYPRHLAWMTDPPPVHLWWLSERSVAELATRHGCRLALVDFTEFNRARRNFLKRFRRDEAPPASRMTAFGAGVGWTGGGLPVRRAKEALLRMPGFARLYSSALGRTRILGPRSYNLCAVLRPGPGDCHIKGASSSR